MKFVWMLWNIRTVSAKIRPHLERFNEYTSGSEQTLRVLMNLLPVQNKL